VAPHDLRRTCARLCHQAGGELDQIQFLLGHVSIQTTERYLGCKQRFQGAVNDHIGLEPDPLSSGAGGEIGTRLPTDIRDGFHARLVGPQAYLIDDRLVQCSCATASVHADPGDWN
jgi:Phage integrase family